MTVRTSVVEQNDGRTARRLSERRLLEDEEVAARRTTESLFYLSAGPMAAILLGMALTPLRGLTTASNLSFAFMALTLVVAELGGRWAAIGTALAAALSLDFFLTQPYLQLAIDDKHDIIAFMGLAVCGLIAASLGSRRGERIVALTSVRKHRELLHSILRLWDRGAPVDSQLAKVLRGAVDGLPLAAAAIRDRTGGVVASSADAVALRPAPEEVLQLDSLVPAAATRRAPAGWDLALPSDGARIALVSGNRHVGWLDIWGNGAAAGVESRRAVSDVARAIGLLLASTAPPGERSAT